MTGEIRSTSKTMRTIKSTTRRHRTIDHAQIARSLGVEVNDEPTSRDLSGSSPALFALRQDLYRLLRSTGGRRSLKGAGKRHKIPLMEGDWERLEDAARASGNEDIHPSPAQVASLLIHHALNHLKQEVNSE